MFVTYTVGEIQGIEIENKGKLTSEVSPLLASQTRNEVSRLNVIELPSEKERRLINALVDEQDTLLFGKGLLRLIGGVSPREHEDLALAVTAAYREARIMHGVFPSPVVSTYLGIQRPSAFDAVVIGPNVTMRSSGAIHTNMCAIRPTLVRFCMNWPFQFCSHPGGL